MSHISLPFILGWLTAIFGMFFLSLYPFYLKKYRKERYKGFWEILGEMQKTPKKAVLLPLGFIGGLVIAIVVDYIGKPSYEAMKIISGYLFWAFILFAIITYGFRIFKVEKEVGKLKRKSEDEKQ